MAGTGIVDYKAPYAALPWIGLTVTVVGTFGLAAWIALSGEWSSIPFGLLWLGVSVWRTYCEFTMMARRLYLTEGFLHWETAKSSGDIPLHQISRIELKRSLLVIEQINGPKLQVHQGQGLMHFLARLKETHPSLDVWD